MGYKGEKDKLGKHEQSFLELMNVPRTESKLRVFSSRLQFNAQVSCLRKSLNIVNSAVEQLGNALNQGTARGSAIGFRLDSLPKLADTLARNNRMTLMHYISKVLADKLPEVLDFSKDLSSLEPAAKAYNDLADYCGVPQLAKKLNQILVQLINTVLPRLKTRISSLN
ncbi:putative dynamin central domain, formin, FH2 domain-containing protein [Helianthus annuus]|uniref:Dynamin central domain, formin, FH2 domain-containing protein n=1 Tax=Helianthus annuus TaxID=4232 RepID=A0A9K3I2E1_HELAN|nr:putative dynamin central domain, formin, FH2 domain-containing protein [Helianthus annuus]KAJ0891456.1 putative dynamin central domain, formin, FH2 domain-containing protein [Helianthus annuus]